jgi:raffinose/stachyose/melibiose transport system permease protein
VLATLVVKNAMMNFDAGYASAIGLTMSIFVGCVISIFIVLRKRGWEI